MVIEFTLPGQASQLAEALDVRTAPAAQKTAEEEARAVKIPEQGGDTVAISQEARALSAATKSDETGLRGGDDGKSTTEQLIDRLEQQIEKLEEEIDELEESDLPEKEKQQQIQARQAQLMQLNDQLLKAQQELLDLSGQAEGGGTRANGFGNSLADF